MSAPGVRGSILLTVMVTLVGLGGSPTHGATPSATAEEPAMTIDVIVGGDLSLGNRMNAHIAEMGASVVLADRVPQIAAADLAIVNLESVVTEGGVQGVAKGQTSPLYFRGRPEMMAVLDRAGIDGVTVANNHGGDYGPEALLEQSASLERMGIAHVGTGHTLEEACQPAYLSAGGLIVALVGIDATQPRFAAAAASPGTCYLPPDDLDRWEDEVGPVMNRARQHAHVVLALVHWSRNFTTEPDNKTRRLARTIVELGADAIIGGNAHRLQGIEVIDGRPVIYDVGTLLFDFPEPHDAAIWSLTLSPYGVERAVPIPLISESGWTRLAHGSEDELIRADLAERSQKLGTAVDGDGGVSLHPPARPEPSRGAPALYERTGYVPRASTEPPSACVADVIPADARVPEVDLGPMTLVGARVAPQQLPGPALVWVETYWTVSAPPEANYWIAARGYPAGRGLEAWGDAHEACDWRWPVTRWVPDTIYVDRHPLRPADSILRLGGLPALLSGGFSGPLEIRVGVELNGGQRDEGPVISRVAMRPSTLLLGALLGAAVALLIISSVVWRAVRSRRLGHPYRR